MKNVLYKSCREYQNTYFVFSNFFKKCAVYEIMWKNIIEPGRPQLTVWYMCIAYWISKATNTHSDYVILIAFSTAAVAA
jgi:hypothetical protein